MKKIGVTIAEISSIIILYGLTKQILYYNYYGIPINNFIGITEIGILISEELLIIVPVTSIYIGFWIHAKRRFENRTNKKGKPEIEIAEIEGEKAKKRTPNSQIFYSGVLIAYSLGMELIAINRIIPTYIILFVIISVVIFLFILFLLLESFLWHLIKTDEMFSAIIVGFITTIMVIYYTGIEIKNTNQGMFTGTIIKVANKTYLSTDTSYYIGKTKDFIFFHNVNSSSNEIIPVNLVDEFRLVKHSRIEIKEMKRKRKAELKQGMKK